MDLGLFSYHKGTLRLPGWKDEEEEEEEEEEC